MRDLIRFQPGRLEWLIGLIWAGLPVAKLVAGAGTAPWPVTLWDIPCAVGAFGARFAIRHFDRDAIRSLWHCLMNAGLVACLTVLLPPTTPHRSFVPTMPGVNSEAVDFLLYVPVCFVQEEVVFRGALDAHLHHAGESCSVFSAMFFSALWGLWQLPLLSFTGVGGFLPRFDPCLLA